MTGLSKGSIYGNFDSKDEVVTEAFKYNAALLYKGFEEAMSTADNAYMRLRAFVNFTETTGIRFTVSVDVQC